MLSIIARIVQNSKNIGYRIIDTESNQTKDIGAVALYKAVMSGLNIEGLGIKSNELIGTNGNLERYTPINTDGNLINKSSLVVLYKVTGGFICCDFKGKTGRYKEEDIIAYSKVNGISNGKIVSKDGKNFISSILGEYNIIEDIVQVSKENKQLDYRTKESKIAEILHKNNITTLENLDYDTFIRVMDTTYVEERNIDWFIENENTGFIKTDVTILKGGYDFIVQYASTKLIKAKKMGLSLGQCNVSVIYKDGVANRCFAHAKSTLELIQKLRCYYSNYNWSEYESSIKADGYTRRATDRMIYPIEEANSDYWYVASSNNKLINSLEIVINKVDGCCYLALSEHSHIPKSNNRGSRSFILILKFRSLDYGMQYYFERLKVKFRESIERTDMFKIGQLNNYGETGPFTYLINCYKYKTVVDEELYIRYYGKTTKELGIVHPEGCETIIKNRYSGSENKYMQPVYKFNNYGFICRDTRTDEYITCNIGYLDELRVKNSLLEFKAEELKDILGEEKINRIRRCTSIKDHLDLLIALEVEGGDSIDMFNSKVTTVNEQVMRYIKKRNIALFGIRINSNGNIVVDEKETHSYKYNVDMLYININKGVVWGANSKDKKWNCSLRLKAINREWEG